jgi:hypothetical protein
MFLSIIAAAALLLPNNPSVDGTPVAAPQCATPSAHNETGFLPVSLVGIHWADFQGQQVLPIELPELLAQDEPPSDDEYNWAVVKITAVGGGPVPAGVMECGTAIDVVVKGFTSGTGATKAAAYNAAMAQLLGAMPFTCSHCVIPFVYQCKAAVSPNGGTVTILGFDAVVLPDGTPGFRAHLSFNGVWRFACAAC